MSYKVAIDCGHGYNTAGKRTPPFAEALNKTEEGITVTVQAGEQVREHFANVGVAHFLKIALERCGLTTYMSVFGDIDGYMNDVQYGTNGTQDVVARQHDINAQNCDICVSLHFNAYGNGEWNTAKGIELYYHSVASKVGDGQRLANTVWSYLKDAVTGQTQRGVKTSSAYGMCNSTALGVRASILIEHAFMTNVTEARELMCSPTAWKLYAEAEAKGICQYLGVAYVAEGQSSGSGEGQGTGEGGNPSEQPIGENPSDQPSQGGTGEQGQGTGEGGNGSAPIIVDNRRWRVQCGAFAHQKNLDKCLAKLRVNGFTAWYQREGDGMFHVYAGTYNIRGNAVRQSRLLTLAGIANCIKEVTE